MNNLKLLSLVIILLFLTTGVIAVNELGDSYLVAEDNNYTVYINDSISFDEIKVTNEIVTITDLSSAGKFENNESTPTVVEFLSLSFPFNVLRYQDGTLILNMTGDHNITIPSSEYIEIISSESFEEILPSLTLVILSLLGIIMVWYGIYKGDMTITILGGFGTLVIGIYTVIFGMGNLTSDIMRYGIGTILIGIGGYASVRTGYEWVYGS